MAENQCRKCKTTLETTTALDSKTPAPTPGSLSICWYCGALALFDQDLKLRELTADEQADIEGNPKLQRILKGLEVHRRRRMARRN